MNLLDKFNRVFGFTKTESRVVVFLVLTFLLGMGIKTIKSRTTPEPRFNYSSSDSEFAARSKLLLAPDSSRNDSSGSVRPVPVDRDLKLHSVDINLASKAELVALPGIGEAMAERIILYRDENGPFTSVDKLTGVRGIGRKKFDRIAPFCTVGK